MEKQKLSGKRRSELGDQRGQASIMMGIMTMTFVLFFAFVVNTGMLVNAKINLQNAADLAAYAGAAVQARTLNEISFLNYEMRRQYKKFLFRYYVLGNMAQKSFPRAAGGTGKSEMKWSPDSTIDYKVPVVCVTFNQEDNYCQRHVLPAISIPNSTPFDSINSALIENLKAIDNIRNQHCRLIGKQNLELLHLWLWNTDPNFAALSEVYRHDEKLKNMIDVLKGLGSGIGLVPRELLLWRRIKTLEAYVNSPAGENLTLEKIQALQNQKIPEPQFSERKIQAFLSAFYTLGNHTFPSGSIQMDELLPESILKLKDTRIRFDAYALDYDTNGTSGNPSDCKPKVILDGVRSPLPVGVSKDPSVMTYYAVRLKAKARLMFSPFGDLELKAYAAAQPFGSRIGPDEPESNWLRKNAEPGIPIDPAQLNTLAHATNDRQIPNLPIRGEDTAEKGNGWDTKETIGAMYMAFSPDGKEPPKQIDFLALQRAYHVAMGPNPYELTRYNIPYDVDDPMARYFDEYRNMAIWAPVFPVENMGALKSELESLLMDFMGDEGDKSKIAKDALSKYIDRLIAGTGEEYDYRAPGSTAPSAAEGFKVARLADPFHLRAGQIGGGFQPLPGSGGLIVTDPKLLKTSWDDIYHAPYKEKGRIGYSVKFVSFEYLRSGKVPTTGGENGTAKNILFNDDESGLDLPMIQH